MHAGTSSSLEAKSIQESTWAAWKEPSPRSVVSPRSCVEGGGEAGGGCDAKGGGGAIPVNTAGASASTPCYQQRPRGCGPVLAGGSYSLALLSASRESGNFVPYNLLFVNATRGAAR